jgi:uncharacterized protein YutE (UPF0331/DUF86 family)
MESDNPYFRPSYRGGFWELRLSHYPSSILRDIYPLTKSEYRSANLARRASYAYLIQTTEASVTACEEAGVLLGASGPKTMRETFIAAGRLGLLPLNLGEDLAGLADLRNTVVHKNDKVDSKLVVYERLLDLITAGYGAYEAFMAFDLAQLPIAAAPNRVVDREYVRAHIQSHLDDSSMRAKALRRLDRETRTARYVIEPKRIKAFLRITQMDKPRD